MQEPLILMLAPNGATKSKSDHVNIPLLEEEILQQIPEWIDNGISILHLHIRDDDLKHSLSLQKYKKIIDEVNKYYHDKIIIQVTTESSGMFNIEQQKECLFELKPEAASLAVREFVKDDDIDDFKSVLEQLNAQKTWPQFIVYSKEDLEIINNMWKDGLIPFEKPFILLVLGKKNSSEVHEPFKSIQLAHIYNELEISKHALWSACGFGKNEHLILTQAMCLGAHLRIGFENNIYLSNGRIADSNTSLISQTKVIAKSIGRDIASINYVKDKFCLK